MKSLPGIFTAIVTFSLVAHLPLPGADVPAAPDQSGKVAYLADMKPVFDAKCTKCHNAEKAKAGLRMDTLEGVLKGTKKHKLVEPGNSANSRLLKIVESIAAAASDPQGKTKSMHKKGAKPFTREQIIMLKSWIDQGAR